MIEEMLGGRRPRGILVDCGPGRFTGVRVGLAAAHGLAIGCGIPLAGYSSLAPIAATAGGGEIPVALEGRHGQLFVQNYAHDPHATRHPPTSLPPAEAAAVSAAPPRYGPGDSPRRIFVAGADRGDRGRRRNSGCAGGRTWASFRPKLWP